MVMMVGIRPAREAEEDEDGEEETELGHVEPLFEGNLGSVLR